MSYHLYGLGALPRTHEMWGRIQGELNRHLGAAGFTLLRRDETRGPKTWNAMTWRLGPEWEQEDNFTRLYVRVRDATSAIMADVPWWQDVKQVQIRLGLGNDGGLGMRTWEAIGAEYARAGSPGFEWWRLPFVQVSAAIVGGHPSRAPDSPFQVQAPARRRRFSAGRPGLPSVPDVVIAPPATLEPVPVVVEVPLAPALPTVPAVAPSFAPTLATPPGPSRPARELITKTPGAPSPVLVEDEDGRVDVVDTTVAQAAFPWWLAALPVGGLLLWALGKKKPARRNPRKRRRR